MKILTFLLMLLAFPALAQPGPQPSPFQVNGPAISPLDPAGCLVFPSTAAGGCKGAGTANFTGIYVGGASVIAGGTVTSVGLSLPASILSVTGSPVTGSGTLAATLAIQNANTVFAGGTSGGAATPSFRGLVPADFSAITAKTLLANTSASSAVPTASTLTAYLDAVFGTTQGGIIYRGASVWSMLGPGTSTQFLQSGGAAANPAWGTPAGSGTINASTANNLAVYSGSTALSGVATANNGLLVTNGSGVPSIGTALPAGTTATTQASSDNSTFVATTAQVQGAIALAGGVPSGVMVPFAGLTAPAGWQLAAGQAVSRATFASLFTALTVTSTITVTIASPAVVTWTGHGLPVGSPVVFSTTSALPTGITAGTTYFIITAGYGTNVFEISTSVGGAAVNTTGSQSGTQTGRYIPYGNGDGSTTFNLPDLRGRVPAGADAMNGTAVSRLGAGSTGGIIGPAVPGANGGQQSHTLTSTEQASMSVSQPSQFFNFGLSTLQVGSDFSISAGTGNTAITAASSSAAVSAGTAIGGGGAHNVTPPMIVMNYIIKNRRRPSNDNRKRRGTQRRAA